MVSVCFVCLGNICRSPTAEAVMRHLVGEAGLGDADRRRQRGHGRLARGRAARPAQPGRGASAGHPARRAWRGSSRPRTSRATTMCWRWTAPIATSCCALAPTAGGARRCACCGTSIRRAPLGARGARPVLRRPARLRGGVRHLRAACRGLLDHLRRAHGAVRHGRRGVEKAARDRRSAPRRRQRGRSRAVTSTRRYEVALADGRERVREDQRRAPRMACSRRRRGGSPGSRRRGAPGAGGDRGLAAG